MVGSVIATFGKGLFFFGVQVETVCSLVALLLFIAPFARDTAAPVRFC